MRKNINLSADRLVSALLNLSGRQNVCLLDSCAVNHLGSHLLVAGINPLETVEIFDADAAATLDFLDRKISSSELFSFFTISYEFGLKLENITTRVKKFSSFVEPDVFLAVYDAVIVHDYDINETFLCGNEKRFAEMENALIAASAEKDHFADFQTKKAEKKLRAASNFSKSEYLAAVEEIRDLIGRGETYQTNLTQQMRVRLPENSSAQSVFYSLRKNHPAPFAAFLQRQNSTVVSASPERFFKVESGKWKVESEENQSRQPLTFNYPLSTINSQLISASPIKGTRRRGKTADEDALLREELLKSVKDRAENVMIVDLLRNDLGKICEFGSVAVEKLCDLETHPTLFHLVSTIRGELRENIRFSDIIKAVFPCGSITGAPKISTMKIIDRIETAARGLSMGAIGYSSHDSEFKIQKTEHKNRNAERGQSAFPLSILHSIDLSVAIRTIVFHENEAVFNVGGGIVYDSDAESEYEESLLKAKALLNSLGAI